MGFEIAIDQGVVKDIRGHGGSHIGLVDEARGSHRANNSKPVQICFRVTDVDAWYEWVKSQQVQGLREPRNSENSRASAPSCLTM